MYQYVYLTTNLIDGRKYIGQHTTENIDDGYLGSGKIIRNAIKKYGKENFHKEILEYASSKEELDKLEMHYIKRFNATNNPEFYNIAEGGGGTLGVLLSEEHKNKISTTIKKLYKEGKLSSPCKGKFGEDNPNYGKKRSLEMKKKLSKIVIERFKTDNNIRSKIYTEERAKKISETRKRKYLEGKYVLPDISGEKNPMFGKSGSLNPRYGVRLTADEKENLSRIAKLQYKNGRVPPMQNKTWDEETKKKISDSHKGKMTGSSNPNFGKGLQTGKSVICIEKNITYSSIAKAAKDNNCWPHQITSCLNGSRETAGNVHWKYASHADTVPSK